MKKKRLSALIVVKNNIAVQSFNYNSYLPIGRPDLLIENYDRWGVDEIIVQVIDRTKNNLGPDFKLLEKISKLKIMTPLIYGGGIRNSDDAKLVIKNGADRVIVESAFLKEWDEIKNISKVIGSQAVILSLPLIIKNKLIFIYDYKELKLINFKKYKIISKRNIDSFSEILVTDVLNEGKYNSFNLSLLNQLSYIKNSLIVFGGISTTKKIELISKFKNVSCVVIGNFLSYKENAYQQYLKNIKSKNFRNPFYYKN
jgi:cyclase